MCIPGFAERRDVPYAMLSLTLGHDRRLYYAAAGVEFDYSGSAGVAASVSVQIESHSCSGRVVFVSGHGKVPGFVETDFFLKKASEHTELDTFRNYPHVTW
jgi:hypothetical protein